MDKKSKYIFLSLLFSCNTLLASPFTLESSAFQTNAMIPAQYTCDGTGQTVPLSWHNAPEKTKSFAILVQDPDAPDGVWTHWVLYNIPPDINSLKANTTIPDGVMVGKTSKGIAGFEAPCPSLGAHSYHFHIYALDKVLALGDGETSDSVSNAMTGHVIGSAELVGIYQKSMKK